MNTLPAREIKRRGIGAVDLALRSGPVHVIKNDVTRYVVMDIRQYRSLVDAKNKVHIENIRASLRDLKAGRVTKSSARELIEEFGLET